MLACAENYCVVAGCESSVREVFLNGCGKLLYAKLFLGADTYNFVKAFSKLNGIEQTGKVAFVYKRDLDCAIVLFQLVKEKCVRLVRLARAVKNGNNKLRL